MSQSLSQCVIKLHEEHHALEDYQGGVPRWCSGCGDNAILAAMQRLCSEENLAPENTVFVSGIGCSIGAAHWIHAIRYNMNLTVVLHDNHVYGLTKKQASPTSPRGLKSNTTPYGVVSDRPCRSQRQAGIIHPPVAAKAEGIARTRAYRKRRLVQPYRRRGGGSVPRRHTALRQARLA